MRKVHVWLPEELAETLRQHATAKGISLSETVRRLVETGYTVERQRELLWGNGPHHGPPARERPS